MLNDNDITFVYREYTKDPLSLAELKSVFKKLGVAPATLLRKNDAAYKALSWSDDETDDVILDRMSQHPTLLQRPIGILGKKAVVGRPVETLLDL